MNAMLAAYELAKCYDEVRLRNIPTVDAVVAKCEGNVLYLTAPPSPLPDVFFGGAVKFTSGVAEDMCAAIVESGGPSLVLSAAFTGSVTPQAGDTVQLSKGPLGEARVYFVEPDTALPAVQDGKKFLVTVNCIGQRLKFRAFNNKKLKGWLGFMKEFDMEVVCEAPKVTGNGSVNASVREALLNLFTLIEQVQVIAIDYRMDEKRRIIASGDFETTTAMIQRTGYDEMRHAAILEFGVSQV